MNGPLEDSNFITNYKKFVRKLDNLYWKKHPNWYLEFEKFDDEKFKEIDGYFGLYFVSNYGQVVSFHRKLPIVRRSAGGHQWRYKKDPLFKNGPIDIKPVQYLPSPRAQPILQFDLKGNFIKEYDSIASAARSVDVSLYNISLCVRGKLKTSAGFQWRNKEKFESCGAIKKIEPLKKSTLRKKPVIQFELSGKYMREYSSAAEAAKTTGISSGNISSCLRRKTKTAGGYQWRYKNDPAFKNGIKNIESREDIVKVIRKPVFQFNLKGKFISRFSNIVEASHILNIPVSNIGRSQIARCAKREYKTARGYIWKFKKV